MTNTSPTTFVLWTVLSSFLGLFTLYHLWSFDHFRCLKWNSGPYSGAFKRVMTYTYLLAIPLVLTFSMGFAIIKYNEGFIVHPELGIIPKPLSMWPARAQSAVFPLTLCFSVGWSIEQITHLQELCFWLFLVNASSSQPDWFSSLYFIVWAVGSVIAIIYMPIVTIFTRHDPLRSEAFTFLAGSLGSLSLTLWFLPILGAFPSFLRKLRADNVDKATLLRLTKFHELNVIRVLFRFVFCVPLLILGADGIRPTPTINKSMFWTDLIAILASFGLVVSSGITLVIFFPRSIEGELAVKERKSLQIVSFDQEMAENHTDFAPSRMQSPEPLRADIRQPTYDITGPGSDSRSSVYKDIDQESTGEPVLPRLSNMRPNRKVGSQVQLGGIDQLSDEGHYKYIVSGSRMSRNWHPAVHNFTSPIDMAYAPHSSQPTERKWKVTNATRRDAADHV